MSRKIKAKTLRLFRDLAKNIKPPPKLSVAEWADRYRVLSSESSAEAGRWSTDRAPYQRGILDAVSDKETEVVIVKSSAQVGKALDIETPLPTPEGWTTMKEIKVGDNLFDENGEKCKVTFVTEIMEDRKCYEVEFSDGAIIVADEEHLWTVDYDRWGSNREELTLTTREMKSMYRRGKRNHFAIPVVKPLKTKCKKLEINPYTLGVWLGDGNSYSAQISLHEKDKEILEYIREQGYNIVTTKEKRNNNVLYAKIDPYINGGICIRGHNKREVGKLKNGYCAECHRQISLKNRNNDDSKLDPIVNKQKTFHSILKKEGLLKNKHIPSVYLRSSMEQRMELLRGLMDTDGHITKRGRSEFTTTSKKLALGFGELLASLGIKYTKKMKIARATNGKEGNFTKAWRFSFLVYEDRPIFKLRRKLERMVCRTGRRTTETERRRIVRIEETISRPVKCITVNSQSHLYLAGTQMIPTHNTELVNNVVAYHIDYDPAPMMFVMPTVELAQTWSKKRLAPMIRDSPKLRDKIRDSKSRDSDNTILEKGFPGGYIAMTGANSPVGLSSRPIRVLLADEIDRFPDSAKDEGDPLSLAEKRTATFRNRKKVFVSTPTIKGVSKIEREYQEGTQEKWCVKCPVCDNYQPYEWSQIKFDDVTMECKFCKERLTEFEWKAQPGKWISQLKEEKSKKKRSFHLNALASPWERWSDIISEFKEAKKDKHKLQTFVNTFLGEVWEEEEGEGLDYELIYKRREVYNCQVPDNVLLVTAGVDVQDDRFEIEVVGWGYGKESWGIEYKKIYGNLDLPHIWNQLYEYLEKDFYYRDGSKINILCTCIDSGGHYTDEVYRFVKDKMHKRIFAIKGQSGTDKGFIRNPTKSNRAKIPLFNIGVDIGKDHVYSRLDIQEEGPGCCHFPFEEDRGYDLAYFKSLCSEKKVIRKARGIAKQVWVQRYKRNEGLDIRNYATAAMEILSPNFEELRRLSEEEDNSINISVPKKKKRKKKKILSRGI